MANEGTPVFVKIEKYRDLSEAIELIKTKIRNADILLNKIKDLKFKEEKEIDLWHANLEEVKQKMDAVDHTLSRSEGV